MIGSRSQLAWRCRRGTLELDLCLSRFLERAYDSLSDTDKEVFARLVEQSNDDLTAWLINGSEPDDGAFARLAHSIRNMAAVSRDS